MLRFFQRAFCIAVALYVSNAILLLLQIGAWTNMTLEKQSELGLEAALAEAVSGRDLCGMCLFVSEETSQSDQGLHVDESSLLSKLACSFFRNSDPGGELSEPASGRSRFLDLAGDLMRGLNQAPLSEPPRHRA